MYDVIVIGAGVTGSAVARELSRFNAKICVLERAEDVCSGTTKANSGIVHAGFDAEPGTLKAKMNIRGNQMMEQLSKDLDFPFEKNGSLVLCMNEGPALPGSPPSLAGGLGVPDINLAGGHLWGVPLRQVFWSGPPLGLWGGRLEGAGGDALSTIL